MNDSNRVISYFSNTFLFQAKPLLKKNSIRELIDPSLADDFDCRQIKIMLWAASLCIQQSSIHRPFMKQARSLALLKFQLNVVFTLEFAFSYSIYDVIICFTSCFLHESLWRILNVV